MSETPVPQGDDKVNHGAASGPEEAVVGGVDQAGSASTAGAGEDFAGLLAASESADRGREHQVGDKVNGVIVKIEGENAFVDFGGRSEGTIRTAELLDNRGELAYKAGDPIDAFVASVQDEVVLTRRVAGEDRQADQLYQAFRAGIPVEGRIDAVNKWGLGVTIQGDVRAFCPISQVDTRFVENAEEFRGQTLTFRITEFRNQGRNIVLSRRAVLEQDQKREGEVVREKLTHGSPVEGKVTRIESFGAFVDLGGGVEGLLHVSELSHKRVGHPQEVVTVGDQIKVLVIKGRGGPVKGKERISLSMKALEKDPWDEVRQRFPEGTVVEGKVDALEDFGAFVEIAAGVRGLVHVSEIADRRIAHPREALSVGQQVQVVVLEAEAKRRRLRLSIKQVETMESAANLREFHERQKKEKGEEQSGSAMLDALRRARLI
jgi:small subunit ribosomal protein S1